MLNTGSYSGDMRIVLVMNEIAVQAASVKTRILEISKQAAALSAGLQNAAPGERETPNPSIQYLTAIAEALAAVAEECDEVIHPGAQSSSGQSTDSSGT
jgi:hypothetical protein